jgi:hypothetical protein
MPHNTFLCIVISHQSQREGKRRETHCYNATKSASVGKYACGEGLWMSKLKLIYCASDTMFFLTQSGTNVKKKKMRIGSIVCYFMSIYLTYKWTILLSVKKKYTFSFVRLNLLPVLLALSQKYLTFPK